jgi:rod shape-determining protein MreC
VIGSVCEVGYSWCRVRALTEASSSVGAYISRSGEIGVIDGDISMKDTGNCVLSYLSENADVEVGDMVYTSGQGSVYPRDLYIGKVVSVSVDEYLRSKSATVELSVDLESLKYVMIVTDYEIYSEEDIEDAS